jgi:hypothetical protein
MFRDGLHLCGTRRTEGRRSSRGMAGNCEDRDRASASLRWVVEGGGVSRRIGKLSTALSACVGVEPLNAAARVVFDGLWQTHRSETKIAEALGISTRQFRRIAKAYS